MDHHYGTAGLAVFRNMSYTSFRKYYFNAYLALASDIIFFKEKYNLGLRKPYYHRPIPLTSPAGVKIT